jgi:hypothetical protein
MMTLPLAKFVPGFSSLAMSAPPIAFLLACTVHLSLTSSSQQFSQPLQPVPRTTCIAPVFIKSTPGRSQTARVRRELNGVRRGLMFIPFLPTFGFVIIPIE